MQEFDKILTCCTLAPGAPRTDVSIRLSLASNEIEETLSRRMQSHNKARLNEIRHYYITSSVSVQDHPKPVL